MMAVLIQLEALIETRNVTLADVFPVPFRLQQEVPQTEGGGDEVAEDHVSSPGKGESEADNDESDEPGNKGSADGTTDE